MGKRAQFFLLAAVIISAVVISLGITANRATSNREPGNFYDFSYEVTREAGAVLNYEIYTLNEGDLDVFVKLLAKDIRDKNPDANFKFIYGNNTHLVEREFSDETVSSSICIGSSCVGAEGTPGDYNEEDGVTVWNETTIGDSKTFSVYVKGIEHTFPISRHKQVIFIMQKDVDDESFVAIG